MTKCYFCKKVYKGYAVIMSDKLECFVLEQHIKDIYYDKENGICEKCRKKLYIDKVWLWKALLSVELMLKVALIKIKDKKIKKKYEEAIERVKKRDKELEKTKEVIAEIMKNHPASLKEPLKEKKNCIYCGENYGQAWIDDPNEEEPTIENCWWVCIPCNKIIEKQQESAFLSGVQNKFEEEGVKVSEKCKQHIKNLNQEIENIAYEDGQEVACFEIKNNKVKRKY